MYSVNSVIERINMEEKLQYEHYLRQLIYLDYGMFTDNRKRTFHDPSRVPPPPPPPPFFPFLDFLFVVSTQVNQNKKKIKKKPSPHHDPTHHPRFVRKKRNNNWTGERTPISTASNDRASWPGLLHTKKKKKKKKKKNPTSKRVTKDFNENNKTNFPVSEMQSQIA